MHTEMIRISKYDKERLKTVVEKYRRHHKEMDGIQLSYAKIVYELIELYMKVR